MRFLAQDYVNALLRQEPRCRYSDNAAADDYDVCRIRNHFGLFQRVCPRAGDKIIGCDFCHEAALSLSSNVRARSLEYPGSGLPLERNIPI